MLTCDELQHLLADYLGDELPATQRAAAEAHLAQCAACRAHVEGLRAAAGAVSAGLVTSEEAARHAGRLALPQMPAKMGGGAARPRQRTLRLWPALRYAAAILIAFCGGWAAREWRDIKAAELLGEAPHTVAAADAPDGAARAALERRYANVTERYPHASTLGRALLTIATDKPAKP